MEQTMHRHEPAVNFNELLIRVEQDKGLMQELLAMFREEYPRQRQVLQQAVDAMLMPEIQAAGHTLKGMCANLAMQAAAEAAAAVERAGKQQNAEELSSALAALDAAAGQVFHALDQMPAGEIA
jgi:HPt (histidine-containing phosphotransfer) domain-containing protein